jgi:SHS2 domain-containing protein
MRQKQSSPPFSTGRLTSSSRFSREKVSDRSEAAIYIKAVPTLSHMSFKYLDHEADVGIRAEGASVEEAFCEGARAMFNVMADLDQVAQTKRVEITCESDTMALLFVQWLNELISVADVEGMLFSRFEIPKIASKNGRFLIRGTAYGETIDPARHKLKTEVKAATYSGLRYEVLAGRHVVQCVVDL